MNRAARLIATTALAFLLVPTLFADDTTKPKAKAKEKNAASSNTPAASSPPALTKTADFDLHAKIGDEKWQFDGLDEFLSYYSKDDVSYAYLNARWREPSIRLTLF